MKAHVFSVAGKKTKEITLPQCFSATIREDIVQKVLEAKKKKQPYAPSLVAGKQYSARGKIRHRRHVWQTHYGRGMSRIPRKVMSRRGTQFNWEGASVPFAKGGIRAHPPKVIAQMKNKTINKKEMIIAFSSALSATTKKSLIEKRYATLDKKNLTTIPFIVDSNIAELTTKDVLKTLKEMLGNEVFGVVAKKRSKRAGVGKQRGRRHKTNAGLLVVIGEKETIKTNQVEVVSTKHLGVSDLARGGLGRLTVYTENAIKDLEKRKWT